MSQYRSHTVPVYLTDEEYEAVAAAKNRTGESMASVLRYAFLAGQNEPAIRASEREVEPGELARVALEAGAAMTGPEWDGEPFIAAEGRREETEIRLVPESAVAEAVAAERSRIASSLRSLPVAEFLARHGLHLGDVGRPVLCAIAAEIEGPGGSGCGKHPGPQEARDG